MNTQAIESWLRRHTSGHRLGWRPSTWAWVVFALTLAAGALVVASQLRNAQNIQRAAVRDHVEEHAMALQLQIERQAVLGQTLAKWTQLTLGQVDAFTAGARQLVPLHPHIKSMALLPNGVLTQVYPPRDHLTQVDHLDENSPNRRAAAQQARDSGKIALDGPFLQANQTVLLARLPVFIPLEGGERFWGLVSVTADWHAMLNQSKLNQQANKHHYRLIDRSGSQTTTLFENTQLPLQQPVEFAFTLPDGRHWALQAEPIQGWWNWAQLWWGSGLTLLIALLTRSATRQYLERARQERALNDLVRQRSNDLDQAKQTAESNARLLRNVSDRVPGTLVHWRRLSSGVYQLPYASGGLYQLFGLHPHEVLGSVQALLALVLEEDRPGFMQSLEKSFAQGSQWTADFRVERNGQIRWYYVNAVPHPNDLGGTDWFGFIGDWTEEHDYEASLAQSEQMLREAQNVARLGYFSVNLTQGGLWTGSPMLEDLLGIQSDYPKNQAGWERLVHPTDRPTVQQSHQRALAEMHGYNLIYRIVRPNDGRVIWVQCMARFDFDTEGKPHKLVGTLQDITERMDLEASMRDQSDQVRAILENIAEGVILIDRRGIITAFNPAAQRIFGYEAAEAVGQNVKMLMPEPHRSQHDRYINNYQRTGTAKIIGIGREVDGLRKDGTLFPIDLSISEIQNQGQTQYVGLIRDITVRRQHEAEIHRLAYYDTLTSLPNRRLLSDHLSQHLAVHLARHDFGALMLLDLDNFNQLNDSLGHDTGDTLLLQVAQRLTQLETWEGPLNSCMVARLGGDEFAVLIPSLTDNEPTALKLARECGEAVLAELAKPYNLINQENVCTASIGVVLFGSEDQPVHELLKHADLAMYQAKAEGRNTVCLFEEKLENQLAQRAALATDLRLALERNEFYLVVQPQVDHHGTVLGAEALLRWRHPARGLVSPALFIPAAEESGLILPLGHWVLHAGCAVLKEWASHPELAHLKLAINVSLHQFRSDHFVEEVREALTTHQIRAGQLKLELTESVMALEVDALIEKMNRIRAMGVLFSMDDFGTGYSSLSQLKRLPLSQLKIDQSFVREVLTDGNDASIARMVVWLGTTLGMEVIAEGVETEDQRRFLESIGCLQYQGYLFSRPLETDRFAAFVAQAGEPTSRLT